MRDRLALSKCNNIDDLRRLARRRLPSVIYDFLVGGADDEDTVTRNHAAFRNYELVPEALVDVARVDTQISLLGKSVTLPLMLSPTGGTKIFHHTGEIAVARAAAQAGIFYTMSTMSTTTLEDVSASCMGPKMFQLYIFRDRGITHALVERCRAANYDALCLTVDTATGGNRERDIVNRLQMPFRPTLGGVLSIASRPKWALDTLLKVKFGMVNFDNDIMKNRPVDQPPMHFVNTQFDRSVTWKDAQWLADRCPIPLVIKGILSARDARRAADLGATAVMISNHGGRQMDCVPAPIDLVAEIRDAVGDRLQVIVDGGVRRGTDIIKAIARGANACSIGRPYLYGLAGGGQAGVAHALRLLKTELERGLVLMGCPNIASIGHQHVRSRQNVRCG